MIFPSIWYEVSPLTPLEVMAFGIPVICSDLNAASDFIDNGISGLIYKGAETEELVEEIKDTSDDNLVKKLSQNCFKQFKVDLYSSNSYIH